MKKLAMKFASILKNQSLRHYFERQVEKYNGKETGLIGGHSLVSRFHNTFIQSDIWGTPIRIPFETITLSAPYDISRFLKFYFGNYMELPPLEKRKGHHIIKVNFGPYK